MFAVIETGGKQYFVNSGESLKIEKLDTEAGKEVVFDKVLMLAEDDGTNVQIGKPYLPDARIVAVVEEQGRSKKIRVVKYKRKIRYRKVHGHRQAFTKVKVEKV